MSFVADFKVPIGGILEHLNLDASTLEQLTVFEFLDRLTTELVEMRKIKPLGI